ncbi:MAG: hypothetical protein PVF17_10125 [Ignavibacteria bacterium]|jgi:hypothetical protein
MTGFKKDIKILLEKDNFQNYLDELHSYPPQKIINSLFKYLYSTDKKIKENAITGMGEVVSKLAVTEPESARNVIRRLMLSVTEESGSIGWGAPAAMGEIMARSKLLAEEFHNILISYALVDEDNYLDFNGLQKDVISGLKRLASAHPHLTDKVKHLLT